MHSYTPGQGVNDPPSLPAEVLRIMINHVQAREKKVDRLLPGRVFPAPRCGDRSPGADDGLTGFQRAERVCVSEDCCNRTGGFSVQRPGWQQDPGLLAG